MKTLEKQLATYQQLHTHPYNRLTHYVGIPLIIFSIFMLLNWISIDIATRWQISFAWILLIGVLVYYFFLNGRLAVLVTILMIPIMLIAAWVARPAPTQLSATLFFVFFLGGWLLQFLGHYFEKQKPAFLLSVSQLLIGPLFVILEALRTLKLEKYFIDYTHTDRSH